MKALIVVDSRFGNTEQLARVVADVIASSYEVQIVKAPAAVEVDGASLLIVGGPTEAHGLSVNLRQTLKGFKPDSLKGVQTAAFDTRFRVPRLISGSAALGAASRLHKAGGTASVPPESFFVANVRQDKDEKAEPGLVEGEVERAEQWARALIAKLVGVVVSR